MPAEMEKLYSKKSEAAQEIVELYDSYEVEISPLEELKNDDIVTVSVTVDEDYTYAFANGEKEFTVSGLKELEVLADEEIKKHIVVDFVGANERGFSRINNTFSNEFRSLRFTVENEANLKNGDKVALVLEDNSPLRNAGYRLDDDFNLTYEVKELREFPKTAKDIKNIKDIDRLLKEEMEKDFPTERSFDFESRYKFKEEKTLYRQFSAEDYNRDTNLENYGTYIKLYSVEEFNDKEALDNKDPRRVYTYARGYSNSYLDKDGKVNIAELKNFSERHDESYSLETVVQLYEGKGFDIVE